MKLRCAIYSRYSSDRQSPASIDDQIRECREYADRQGWQVLDAHIYSDRAISGTTSERQGLKGLMAAAEAKLFDVVLVDDTSRLSRRLVDALTLKDQLLFHGIRLISVSQNIDSGSEQGETLAVVHGLVDGLYVRELATKTRRGLEGKALAKLHTGGKIFGYRSVPIEDPNRRDQYGRAAIAGARLEVDEVQAKIVRKIFSLYAAGLSLKGVAKRLNKEHIPSSQPRHGRQQSWAPSSVRVILRNERYRGVVTWSKTKKVRNPTTGKRVRRARPKSEWLRVEMPEQRIVPESLWKAVEERRAYITRTYGLAGQKGGKMNLRAAASPYIFSGLLRCGICGSNFMIVSGSGRNHSGADYGCPAHALRGTCTNARRVKRETLERELLAKLQNDVLSDAAIDFVMEMVEAEIQKRAATLDGEMDAMRKRKAALETQIQNLSRAIASGPEDMPSLRVAIVEREQEITALTSKILGRGKGSVRQQIVGLRKFVHERMGDIRSLLAGKHASPLIVRQELSRHIDAITLLPEGKGDSIRYKGAWKPLGGIGGAEGQS